MKSVSPADATRPSGSLGRMGTLLTQRRAVDLCRVGSCLCRVR
jgi:hypothetical protein